ncbi:MAG TPA: hypothetical protein VFE58_17950 [Tepidisphaeraceae bacterium]|jgi:hypothetical protein|nr:hypothetical protein [Tepidisphaeraceae bacterium]
MPHPDEQPVTLNYAHPNTRSNSRVIKMLNTIYAIAIFFGILLLILGFLEHFYQPLSIAGSILIGSALIAAAITHARPRQ